MNEAIRNNSRLRRFEEINVFHTYEHDVDLEPLWDL